MPPPRVRRRPLCVALFLLGGATLTGCLTLRAAPAADDSAGEADSARGAEATLAPKTLDADLPAPALRYAVLTRLLARRLRAVAGDCGEIAVALDAWTRRNGAELRALLPQVDAWEAVAGHHVVERYYEVVFPDIEVRIEAGARCDGDQRARAAFERFFDTVGLDGG